MLGGRFPSGAAAPASGRTPCKTARYTGYFPFSELIMNDEQKEILKTLLPYLLATALITASLVLGVVRWSSGGVGALGAGQVVSFDVIKFGNAQRAVAASFLKGANNDNATLLLDLSKKTRESIHKVAGSRLVLLKQAVVQGNVPDITDAVLKDLGLPVDVPTQDPTSVALDVAPTMLNAPASRLARPGMANPDGAATLP